MKRARYLKIYTQLPCHLVLSLLLSRGVHQRSVLGSICKSSKPAGYNANEDNNSVRSMRLLFSSSHLHLVLMLLKHEASDLNKERTLTASWYAVFSSGTVLYSMLSLIQSNRLSGVNTTRGIGITKRVEPSITKVSVV